MLIKAYIVAIVTLTLATSAKARPYRPTRWDRWRDFLCSDIWRVKDDSTFETTRIPEMRTLVGSSSVDVGTCPLGSCNTVRYIHNYDCGNYGYICRKSETKVADLGPILGNHTYEYVTNCACCEDEGVKISVHTVDSKSGESLSRMTVLVNNEVLGVTNEDGQIESTIKYKASSLVFRAEAERGGDKSYLNAVKVDDSQLYFRGPIDIKLHMTKKAKPVEIDPKKEQKLSLSDNPSDPNAGNAFIVIAANSFPRRGWWGRPSEIKASVTFLDTNTGSEDPIPGRFLTPVGNTYENMISAGIIAFEFTDSNDNVVRPIKPIKFYVPLGMQLWNLNIETGNWEAAKDLSERRKRQVTLTEEYLIDIGDTQWINIDKIPGAPRCYFKARIFNATSGDEITSSITATFRPEILAYTNQNQRLRLYPGSTSSPSDTCFEVRCPDVSDPNDALTGFINMSSTESVSLGGVTIPYKKYLTPRNLAGYIPQIQTRHSAVQYAIAPNGLDVFVNFVSHGAGPFYPNINACENSPANRPAFHFYKPDLPSYVPGPNDSDICTARIAFRGSSGNFYNYTSNLTSLPNITGISTWTTDNGAGNIVNNFFTYTVQLQESTSNESDYFVYACLEYRCSTTNEPTTVYLDIHVPNITYFYNKTYENGSIMEANRTFPAFYCKGACEGSMCHRDINGTTIEGTFQAPVDVGTGPDFYDSQNTDCDDRTSTEDFAFEFFCYGNRRWNSEQRAKRRIEV